MSTTQANSFGSQATLDVEGRAYTLFRLDALYDKFPGVRTLPYSMKILLENLLRNEDGLSVRSQDVAALAGWDAKAEPSREIAYTPARTLLQDFTGVPCVVDLAAMRDAMRQLGGDPKKINPLSPVELVIDHSVQVDVYGTKDALLKNARFEFDRNKERYQFLRWGQKAFRDFAAVPPDTGIVHQVNIEHLARVVFSREPDGKSQAGKLVAYPDTLVGTDSHTTMVNGLGVLGWGVGGIEAEAAMLGQPVSMLIPQVIGFRVFGKMQEGTTATDLVLTVTQMLRKKGVVGKFVEFFGDGVAALSVADRCTIANMAPEYGATCGIFPVDEQTLAYLRLTGRSEHQVKLVEAYAKAQGMFLTKDSPAATYTDTLELDLGTVRPCLAGPSRPQDRVLLGDMKKNFEGALPSLFPKRAAGAGTPKGKASVTMNGETFELSHGSVVIAAITSCTNTSNPSVLIAAGLLAKKAVEKGLKSKPWVKTSLAPGSKVVTDYLTESGLIQPLQELNFFLVGYGCTTCIGNSGPLLPEISKGIVDGELVVASVLSGNRNFEGRVHSEVRANYLASPPLVVAYAIAGRVDVDLTEEPLGIGKDGKPVFLKDIWPAQQEIDDVLRKTVKSESFKRIYADVYKGPEEWETLAIPEGDLYRWDVKSTYVKHPPYFEGMTKTPGAITDIAGARALAVLGDSITTDHISPAGSIKKDSPAGKYLIERTVEPKDFNSYGSRRGNHEVMVRGTFANVRLKNMLAPGTEGGVTRHIPSGDPMTIFDASVRYAKENVPLVILAGKEYGSGSSRDWAAKGPKLLGVRAVIAESFERIHRSNLVGMGILPLQFKNGENAQSLGLTGEEVFAIAGLGKILDPNAYAAGRTLCVQATKADGTMIEFNAIVRVDTPQEVHYYRHGGILPYVLRSLVGAS
jgi:aconitate hydratase